MLADFSTKVHSDFHGRELRGTALIWRMGRPISLGAGPKGTHGKQDQGDAAGL
jgi:hypothetical protein